MSSPISPQFESADVALFEFTEADLVVDRGPHPENDEFLRRIISDRFATEGTKPVDPARLARLLALAREREQYCRGARDHYGLARCLGNQALLLIAQQRSLEAMPLLEQVETLCRRLEDREGLIFALTHRASLLAGSLAQPAQAQALAEQALRLAEEQKLNRLVPPIRAILDRLQ